MTPPRFIVRDGALYGANGHEFLDDENVPINGRDVRDLIHGVARSALLAPDAWRDLLAEEAEPAEAADAPYRRVGRVGFRAPGA